MTSQTSSNTGWRRHAVAGTARCCGPVGVLAATALMRRRHRVSAHRPMTPTRFSTTSTRDYDTGAGGGQVSNLIHSA